MLDEIIEYNKSTAARLGWSPKWFNLGENDYGKNLVEAIKKFQKDHGLSQDGKVGPMTYTRLFTEREDYFDSQKKGIYMNGTMVDIGWSKIEFLASSPGHYKEVQDRTPTQIVTHWDATLNAKYCHNILEKRGISVHFCIDNDGTIYQFVDTSNKAYHVAGHNGHTIGIDFSNAYYLKYNDWYERHGHGKRPVIESTLHGRNLGKHLGYYPVQVKAYKHLINAITKYYNIPLQVPEENGKLVLGEDERVKRKEFKGIVCHYHITDHKIDAAGLPLREIVNDVKENKCKYV